MRHFKNLKTGYVECPQNPEVIKQYEKYTDLYEEIKSKRNAKKDEHVEEIKSKRNAKKDEHVEETEN